LHSQAAGSGSSIRLADSTSGTSGDVGLLMGQYSNSSYFINRDNANMYFWTGGAERVRVDTGGRAIIGGGITLGNGQTYAAANTLDDYEEGTWTPFYCNGAKAAIFSAMQVYSARYTKIGNLVSASCYIAVPSGFSTTGNYSASTTVLVGGLPYASIQSAQDYVAATIGYYTGWQGFASPKTPVGYTITNDTTIELAYSNGPTVTGIPQSTVNNTGASIIIAVTYKTTS